MFVLIVLFGSLLLFRFIGFFGMPIFASWHAATTYALALMFLFTASAHFGRLKGDLERMVPPWVPNPRAVVLITGFLEILPGSHRRTCNFFYCIHSSVTTVFTVRDFPCSLLRGTSIT
jgi:uncharacterized membrane protein